MLGAGKEVDRGRDGIEEQMVEKNIGRRLEITKLELRQEIEILKMDF